MTDHVVQGFHAKVLRGGAAPMQVQALHAKVLRSAGVLTEHVVQGLHIKVLRAGGSSAPGTRRAVVCIMTGD